LTGVFRDKQQVLAAIPIGTAIDQAQKEMMAHGFQEWRKQRQDNKLTLLFHASDAPRFGNHAADIWVTIYADSGVVKDIDFLSESAAALMHVP
jgi:hypothetical protein